MSAPPALFATLLALLAAPAVAAQVPAAVQRELDRAVVTPNGWAKVTDYRPSVRDCQVTAASSPPVLGSGTIAVRLFGDSVLGSPCDGWAWVRVQVFARVLVTTRPVAASEPLSGALALAEHEVLPRQKPLTELPEAAVAVRGLPAGSLVQRSQLRGPGPAAGEPVTVVARAGGITLELPARVAACSRGRACALLPSGKRVEGRLEGSRLLLEEL